MSHADEQSLMNPPTLSHLARDSTPETEGPMCAVDRRSWRVRCQVVKKNGERCKRWAMRGSVVCSTPQHGAAFPSVRRAAERRLLELVNLSLDEFRYCMLPNVDKAIRLRAAKQTLKLATDALGKRGMHELTLTERNTVDAAIETMIKSRS